MSSDMRDLLGRFNQLLDGKETSTARYLSGLDEDISTACEWSSKSYLPDDLRSEWVDFGIKLMKEEALINDDLQKFRDEIKPKICQLEKWVSDDG